jgi:hypothetical protein
MLLWLAPIAIGERRGDGTTSHSMARSKERAVNGAQVAQPQDPLLCREMQKASGSATRSARSGAGRRTMCIASSSFTTQRCIACGACCSAPKALSKSTDGSGDTDAHTRRGANRVLVRTSCDSLSQIASGSYSLPAGSRIGRNPFSSICTRDQRVRWKTPK